MAFLGQSALGSAVPAVQKAGSAMGGVMRRRPGLRPKQPSVGSLGPRKPAPMAPSPETVRRQFVPPTSMPGHLPLVTANNNPAPTAASAPVSPVVQDLGSNDPREIARVAGLAPSTLPTVSDPGLSAGVNPYHAAGAFNTATPEGQAAFNNFRQINPVARAEIGGIGPSTLPARRMMRRPIMR